MTNEHPNTSKKHRPELVPDDGLDDWVLSSRRRQVDCGESGLVLARARHRLLSAVEAPVTATKRQPRWARSVPSGRRWAPLAAVGAAAVALVVLSGTMLRSEPASAAIEFDTLVIDGSEFVVARINDPFLAADEYNAAFAERGLSIEVELVAASPSMVGSPVAVEDGNGDSGIRSLDESCDVACPLGVRVPIDFDGEATITLGRPALAGERYEVAANADSAGEPFADLELDGMSAGRLQELARVRGIILTFQTVVDEMAVPVDAADVEPDRSVVGSTSLSSDEVLVWLE